MRLRIDDVGNPDQIVSCVESEVVDGDGRHWRAIDISHVGGLRLRILPDRGLDMLDAWFSGMPLHWVGPAGEGPPQQKLDGQDWERWFFGGILTTCGLSNVGEPSEGVGLHGRFNHLQAENVRVSRRIGKNGSYVGVSGRMTERTIDGGLFAITRRISLSDCGRRLSVSDRITNEGISAPAPMLYHINFGWPFMDDETEVSIDGRRSSHCEFGRLADPDTDWRLPWRLPADSEPVTVEHVLTPDEPATVSILSPSCGIAASIRWERNAMPRLMQWINKRPGWKVMAVEPGNSGTKGRHIERAAGTLPMLEAGETRVSGFTLDVRKL